MKSIPKQMQLQLEKQINVLSLFDGMSCGRIALDKIGKKVGKYYASEIDKYAEIVSNANYPDIIRTGDVTEWRNWSIDWASIDLIMAGSPCQRYKMLGNGWTVDVIAHILGALND